MSRESTAEEPQTIATLRPGEMLDGVFACVRKERSLSRNGSPYLTVELRDGSGSVIARAFRDADLLSGRFEKGEIVRVKGRVERYRDDLTVSLEAISRVQASEEQMARFLPAARRDLDELEGFLEHLVREIYDESLRGLCERMLADGGLRRELRRAPCGLPGRSGAHHAYLGGLLEHTVAVTSLAVEVCAVHPKIDRDMLICASVIHDLGRTREFAYGAEISRTEEGRLLGHVELGLRLIASFAPRGLPDQRRLALEHCVAMHHGGEGSGEMRFASVEAVALHRVNALDVGVKGAVERGLAIK